MDADFESNFFSHVKINVRLIIFWSTNEEMYQYSENEGFLNITV